MNIDIKNAFFTEKLHDHRNKLLEQLINLQSRWDLMLIMFTRVHADGKSHLGYIENV